MTLRQQFNLAPKNMLPISRFKRAYRLIENTAELRTAENDMLLRLLFTEAFPDHEDFPRDLFRPLLERAAMRGVTNVHLPRVILHDVLPAKTNTTNLSRQMPFYTYVQSFYQCYKDSELILGTLLPLTYTPR